MSTKLTLANAAGIEARIRSLSERRAELKALSKRLKQAMTYAELKEQRQRSKGARDDGRRVKV